MNILQCLLTGAAGAALIKLIDNIIQWRLNRKAQQEDKEAEKQEEAAEVTNEWMQHTTETISLLAEGQKCIMLDRIQYLCRAYLKDGEVDYDDRRRLHLMHDAYHDLRGNGDLNVLMSEVDDLPLKE